MHFSKSKYTSGVQCPKICWMQRHMPEQFNQSVMNEAVLSTGNIVGDLAMGYYGSYTEVPFNPGDPDRYQKAAAETKRLIAAGEKVICEATFTLPGHYCMVDILRRREDDSFDVVEVKSSTHMKDIYFHDMAYQCWLVEQCGYRVASTSLMHLDNTYVRQGDLDLYGLFAVEDCTAKVREMMGSVASKVRAIAEVADANDEPAIPLGPHCFSPYECGFRPWCWRHLPSPNVFDIGNMSKKKGFSLMERGCTSFPDLLANPDAFDGLSVKQQTQVLMEAKELDPVIDRTEVKAFLESLTYPLYFLDFETFQEAVPSFDGQRPFEQITSQYSLHWVDDADGPLHHAEFLGEAGLDPQRSVAEHLCEDIPRNVCVLAWNQGFEKGRIKHMAELFPDLAGHLMAIHGNIRDLAVPFQKGHYCTREMGGSYSIKAVLPALFPDDPELDYHRLEGVHNGGEASSAFQHLANRTPAEQTVIREQLLRYCELDTLAMVRIWEKLREVAE